MVLTFDFYHFLLVQLIKAPSSPRTEANSPASKEGKFMENGTLVNEAQGKLVMRYGWKFSMGLCLAGDHLVTQFAVMQNWVSPVVSS